MSNLDQRVGRNGRSAIKSLIKKEVTDDERKPDLGHVAQPELF
jgi:hypothetical protein